MSSRLPHSLVAAVILLGTLGAGRAFFMLVFAWYAAQAGAHDVKNYAPFAVNLVLGLVVLGIALSLVRRARWAWIGAMLASLAMLVEELWRSVPGAFVNSDAPVKIVTSVAYILTLVVVIVFLSTKSSREYLRTGA